MRFIHTARVPAGSATSDQSRRCTTVFSARAPVPARTNRVDSEGVRVSKRREGCSAVTRSASVSARSVGLGALGTAVASGASGGGGSPHRGGVPTQVAPIVAHSVTAQFAAMTREPSQRASQLVPVDAPEVKKGVRRAAPSRLSSTWRWSVCGREFDARTPKPRSPFQYERSHTTRWMPMCSAFSTSQLAT